MSSDEEETSETGRSAEGSCAARLELDSTGRAGDKKCIERSVYRAKYMRAYLETRGRN